jgi:rhamnogalacturonyl hydrolase YesR
MQTVANWQLTHFEKQTKAGSQYINSHSLWSWTNGVMYVGMLEWAKLSHDGSCFQFLKAIGEKEAYNPGPNLFHADDICVGQLYLELFANTGIRP